MAYQALYRKWRPRTFGSVVGQEDITATLKNAIKRDTVSHAFLFAGPRGTGKTSCAQIFAKALNCTNLQDGNPCNECANCLAADRDTMPDIIEIDAASNNGVDEIRDIRDKVKYAPTQGKYKVYIIDEVHMLSMGAFNALLKTLEEPPQHVIFILATTELQKVPATIISRTQRYNFKRISQKQLVLRMKYILDKEKITYEEKALTVIAQVADGGMRDALSILDQLLSYEKGSVDYATALKITGFADQKKIEQIFLAILNKDATEALTSAQEVLASGANVKNVLDELIELTTRALILVKTQESEGNFLTPDFAKKVKQVPLTHYFRLITLANQALNDLRYTNQQEIPLTVFLVEMADDEVTQINKTSQDQTLQKEVTDLKKQVTSLTRQMNNLSSASIDKKNNQVIQQVEQNDSSKNQTLSKKIAKPKKVPKNTKAQSEKNRQHVYQVLVNATKKNLQTIKDIWTDLHSVLAVSERALLDVLEPVAASSEQVVMKCEYTLWFEKASSDSDLLERLASEIEKFTKHNYEIVLVPADDWLNIRAQFLKEHKKDLLSNKKKKKDKINDDSREVVDKAKELFGDTVKIKD